MRHCRSGLLEQCCKRKSFVFIHHIITASRLQTDADQSIDSFGLEYQF